MIKALILFSEHYSQPKMKFLGCDNAQLHRTLLDNVDVHRQHLGVLPQVEEADVAWFQLVVSHKLPPAFTKDLMPPVLGLEFRLPCIVLAATWAPKPHSRSQLVLVATWKILSCIL